VAIGDDARLDEVVASGDDEGLGDGVWPREMTRPAARTTQAARPTYSVTLFSSP